MNVHKNARLTPLGRERLVGMIACGMSFAQAGAICGCSAKTATKWWRRYEQEGREGLLEQLEDCPLPVEGDEGYATAEATGGGVRLSELKLKTLESRKVSGLHFAGEVIDVDGRIGGFNFLWSWVSGRKAGEAAAKAFLKS